MTYKLDVNVFPHSSHSSDDDNPSYVVWAGAIGFTPPCLISLLYELWLSPQFCLVTHPFPQANLVLENDYYLPTLPQYWIHFYKFILSIKFEILCVVLLFNHLQIEIFKDVEGEKNLVTYQFNLDSNKINFWICTNKKSGKVVVTVLELFEDQDNYSIQDNREYNILASYVYSANLHPLTDVQTQYFKNLT